MLKPIYKSVVAILIVAGSGALAQAQTTIPSTYVLPASAADASKPGFVWRFHQVASGQPNTLAFTESQLAGDKGNNIGDPASQGIAIAPGVAPTTPEQPITFEISGVINLDKNAGSFGNFTPDDQMPGLPGTNPTFTDNTAAEVLTYLDLPAGTITMGVNSDDGFRVAIGGAAPQDKFNNLNVGQFDGGRGAADTLFTIVITQPGLYAARTIWENGGGDANVEWFTMASDGVTKVLVNDSVTAGSIKAYRAVTVPPAKAYVRTAIPAPGSTGVGPNGIIKAEIVDGPTAIDPLTVRLVLDSNQLAVTPTKVGGVTTVSYTPNPLYASGSSHNVSLIYTEGGNSVTQSWSFSVQVYANVPPSFKVTPDTTKSGFNWNIFANSANQDNYNGRTEMGLAGLLNDAATGTPLPNLADPAVAGAALGVSTAPNPANAPIHFEIASVINLGQDSVTELNGNFQPDLQMPGVPPTDGIADGLSVEIITYVELPAGLVTMGVNSDDGFRTSVGIDALNSLFAAQFEGGRGASDTIFNLFVQEAGVYPLRTIYEEGGGGANVEWFSVKANGTKSLLNDTGTAGLKTYRAVVGTVNPYVKSVFPGKEPRQLNNVSSAVTVVLADGTNPVDQNSVVLTLDGQVVVTTKERFGNALKVTYTPTTLQVPTDIHTASITFKDSTGAFTGNGQWQFRNLKNLILPTPKITEDFDSYPEDTQPTGWVAWNFTAHCDDGRDITSQTSESYENWVLVSTANAPSIDGNVLNVAPGQFFNGQPVTTISAGNILYGESDSRCGNGAGNVDSLGRTNRGQTQFIISKPFNCSQITNVVLTLSALYEQNQDSYGGIEYSVDAGATWLPVVYFLDAVDGGGDIRYNADGSVDAVATFSAPTGGDTSGWITTNGEPKGSVAGGKGYGDGLGAAITPALGDYVAPRINDNAVEGARIEVFRLTQASKKPDVRLRFSAMGTDSWWFAVDNIAFYDVASTVAVQPQFNPTTVSGNSVTLSWTGTGTLQETTTLGSTASWTASASQSNPQTVTAAGTKFYRISQ